ncbi:MAG: hypothetical protein ABIV13_03985 [Fimbriimonadales bacterium]
MIAEAEPLGHRTIFRFYFPLALSWIFMAIESPIAVGVLSRLPQPELSTAAFFIMMALALWIESPVIDLLSTSTTLAKNRDDFRTLTKFVYWILLLVTAVHALVGFTPLFEWIASGLLGVPENIAAAAKPGFQIMTFWSACIGWRRFLQGVLIRFGATKMVGFGTFVRMTAMAVSALLMFFYTEMRSVEIAATSLMASVLAESIYIHLGAGPIVRNRLELVPEVSAVPLTMRKLIAFHAPLTATTTVMMLGSPLVAWALAKSANPKTVLAAWQVSSTLAWLCRTVVFALPEVVITLYRDEQSAEKLRRFCLGVGLLTSSILILLAAFRVDVVFFLNVLKATPNVAEVAHTAFLAVALLPLIGAMQSYVRGMLTAHHLTVARFTAVIVAMAALGGLLFATVVFGIAGVISASLALTGAMIAEFFVLARALRKSKRGYAG